MSEMAVEYDAEYIEWCDAASIDPTDPHSALAWERKQAQNAGECG